MTTSIEIYILKIYFALSFSFRNANNLGGTGRLSVDVGLADSGSSLHAESSLLSLAGISLLALRLPVPGTGFIRTCTAV